MVNCPIFLKLPDDKLTKIRTFSKMKEHIFILILKGRLSSERVEKRSNVDNVILVTHHQVYW